MTKHSMTDSRYDGLTKIIDWYYKCPEDTKPLTRNDFNFIYDIWDKGILIYGEVIQTRLNKIREIYLKNK